MTDQELMHYGVKGMKWGVRRSLGAKARTAALYKRTIKDLDRSVGRLERKKSKKGLTDRQQKRLDKRKRLRDESIDFRNKLIKDLSEKDIRQGERALAARGILFGGVASGMAALGDLNKATRDLEREKNR